MIGADRNLLIGVLALQHNFISSDALVSAFRMWIADKSRNLCELLHGHGELTMGRQKMLNVLATELMKEFGSAEKCLEQCSSISLVKEDLTRLSDPDLNATLQTVAESTPPNRKTGQTTLMRPASASDRVQSTEGTRYRVLRPHAEGGLGVVSVAHDVELNREVALKEIKRSYADDDESRGRFVLEAEITGGLEHPGIVSVYGLGQYADGRPYYAMRFIRGDSLKQALDEFHADAVKLSDSKRNLQLRRLPQRFIGVCEAMHYAHSRGVIHRDLKPGNIMLGKYGETLVVDWGLARTAVRDQTYKTSPTATRQEANLNPRTEYAPTRMGQVIGTPQFMSPEQAAGKLDQLGPATDIYALGATLYSILTGKPPVSGQGLAEVLDKVSQGRVTAPRQINPNMPRPLEAICLRALALLPADRYDSSRALAEDIEHWLADEPVAAYREPIVAQVRRVLRKRPMVTGSIVASLLVGMISLAIGSFVVGKKNTELSQTNLNLVIARRDALTQ